MSVSQAPKRYATNAKGETLRMLTLRLPAALHARLQRLAREEDRSLTAEIVALLREGARRRKKHQAA
jgi:hypothetical protein